MYGRYKSALKTYGQYKSALNMYGQYKSALFRAFWTLKLRVRLALIAFGYVFRWKEVVKSMRWIVGNGMKQLLASICTPFA